MKTKLILGCVVCMLLTGCKLLHSPGGEVREIFEHRANYRWGPEEPGGPEVVEVNVFGPQTNRFIVAGGKDLKFKLDKNGKLVPDIENSTGIEWILFADPSADAAASLGTVAFEASSRQVEAMAASFNKMLSLLESRLPGGVSEAPTSGE